MNIYLAFTNLTRCGNIAERAITIASSETLMVLLLNISFSSADYSTCRVNVLII